MLNIGTQFENDLSEEFNIKQTPNSGSVWHSKLDLVGYGARWSLKATSKKSISISQNIIDEAVRACEGPSGDSSIPIWALRIGSPDYDVVVLRKNDFKRLQNGELQLIQIKDNKATQRRERSNTPILLREND